ncbi:WhiB family transcriptional regulator [Streptomyces canus]|uniref:WhiB family transcriptional regulator n=1 Tax=Streptomyces canus TaxID=58343 RepID=UPI0036E24077
MRASAPNGRGNALAWADQAACAGRDLNEFFTTDKRRVAQVKNVCASCTVRELCLAEALRAEDTSRFGVFGGLTPAEREQAARAQ